jgi:hypothetical protein
MERKSMIEFPHEWRVNTTGEYVQIDVRNSNYHRGSEYRRVQLRNDGSYYMIFNHIVWNF